MLSSITKVFLFLLFAQAGLAKGWDCKPEDEDKTHAWELQVCRNKDVQNVVVDKTKFKLSQKTYTKKLIGFLEKELFHDWPKEVFAKATLEFWLHQATKNPYQIEIIVQVNFYGGRVLLKAPLSANEWSQSNVEVFWLEDEQFPDTMGLRADRLKILFNKDTTKDEAISILSRLDTTATVDNYPLVLLKTSPFQNIDVTKMLKSQHLNKGVLTWEFIPGSIPHGLLIDWIKLSWAQAAQKTKPSKHLK